MHWLAFLKKKNQMCRLGKRVQNLAVTSLVCKALCNFSLFSKKWSVRK